MDAQPVGIRGEEKRSSPIYYFALSPGKKAAELKHAERKIDEDAMAECKTTW